MTTTREAALEAALLKTRRLVCEAAEVGFNYADGDWADRLYRNNGDIAAALSTPAADTRVVAVELLDRAMKTTMSGIVRAEIRAIIDTAILALRDKPAPVVTVGGGLCGCCGERPIAYPSEGECIDCFSANEGGEL